MLAAEFQDFGFLFFEIVFRKSDKEIYNLSVSKMRLQKGNITIFVKS